MEVNQTEEILQDLAEEKNEECLNCGSENTELIYENNGFSYPDGPTRIECVGIACLDCGQKEYD